MCRTRNNTFPLCIIIVVYVLQQNVNPDYTDSTLRKTINKFGNVCTLKRPLQFPMPILGYKSLNYYLLRVMQKLILSITYISVRALVFLRERYAHLNSQFPKKE